MKHFYDENLTELYQHQFKAPSGQVFENLLDGFFGQLNTVLIPKEIFKKVGMFDENFRDSEEWDMFLRIARAGYTFGFLNEDLVRIRIRQSSLSRFENQWKVKLHNIHVFEDLNKNMSEEERKKYNMHNRLAKLHFKSVVAYLVGGNKRSALIELQRVKYDNFYKRVFIKIIYAIVFVLPTSFLRFFTIKIWTLKNKNLFKLAT